VPIPELSQTEKRIVLLVAQGRSRPEIAAVVGLDIRTVDWHLAQGNRKLEKAAALLDRVRGKENERKEQTKCATSRRAGASRD
jgi:DNA-binding NarL/FixJ family response regulator